MQPFPYLSDATHKIWSRLANWLQRYSSLKVWTTDDDDRPLVYYKLTLWAFGSGELKTKVSWTDTRMDGRMWKQFTPPQTKFAGV